MLLQLGRAQALPVVRQRSKALFKTQGELDVMQGIATQRLERIFRTDFLSGKLVPEQGEHIADIARWRQHIGLPRAVRHELPGKHAPLGLAGAGDGHGIHRHDLQRTTDLQPQVTQRRHRCVAHPFGIGRRALHSDQHPVATLSVRDFRHCNLRSGFKQGADPVFQLVGNDLHTTAVDQVVRPTVKKQISILQMPQIIRQQPSIGVTQVVQTVGIDARSRHVRSADHDAAVGTELHFRTPYRPTDRVEHIRRSIGNAKKRRPRCLRQPIVLHDQRIGKQLADAALFICSHVLRADLHPAQMFARFSDDIGRGQQDPEQGGDRRKGVDLARRQHA